MYVLCNSSVGIANRYELGGQGIESQWGEIFSTRPDWPWDPPNLLHNRYRVSSPGVKQPGRGVDHPPLSSAEVKEGVELYLYSPSVPSWPVIGRILLYIYIYIYIYRCILTVLYMLTYNYNVKNCQQTTMLLTSICHDCKCWIYVEMFCSAGTGGIVRRSLRRVGPTHTAWFRFTYAAI
jgi:hypothetical protein